MRRLKQSLLLPPHSAFMCSMQSQSQSSGSALKGFMHELGSSLGVSFPANIELPLPLEDVP